MTDILVDEPVCNACGADIRADSLFCYNCGESLDSETGTTGETSVNEGGEREVSAVRTADETAIGESRAKAGTNGGDSGLARVVETDLRSAAALRRGARSFDRKPIRIVWEPAEPSSSRVFVVVTLVVLVFALCVVATALYYR